MHKELLNYTPKAYYCPVCDQMHRWNPTRKRSVIFKSRKKGCLEECSLDVLKCPNSDAAIAVGVKNGEIIYESNDYCKSWDTSIVNVIDADEINEKEGNSLVTYTLRPDNYAGKSEIRCQSCEVRPDSKCLYNRTGNRGYNIGFEYYSSDYIEAIERAKKEELEKKRKEEMERAKRTNTSATEVKAPVTDNKMKLWTKLIDQSPKQNFHEALDWVKAHETTFKWAVPVVSIFVAYKILNSEKGQITIDNVNNIAKEKLGVSLDSLQNKKALKRLMEIGGVCAAVYGAYEFFNRDKKPDDVEATMEALEKVSQENRFLGKQAEKLLPVATSVIIVYLMTQQPKWLPSKDQVTEVIKFVPSKVRTYGGLFLGEAAERFGIDTDDEEMMHKVRIFAFLGLVVAAIVLFYGVKMIKKRDEAKFTKMEENMKAFVQQILAIMKALIPTAFSSVATILVTRKVLEMSDLEDVENDEVETVPADEVTVE